MCLPRCSICQFLSQKNVTTLYHPPYSPHLSQPDYFLFPKLKMKLKGLHFVDVAEIQKAVNWRIKKKVQKKEFSAAFQKLYDRAKACIYANGAYFEFKKKVRVFLMCLRFLKKSVLKLLDRTAYYVFCTMHCNIITQHKPISSTIAEIFLQYFQDKHIKHFLDTKNVTFYVHYVDDILII